MAMLTASRLVGRWVAFVYTVCALFAIVSCNDSDGFSSRYDNEQALMSTLGCTFFPDDNPAPLTKSSGTCDILNAPLEILFFDGPDERRQYADEHISDRGGVFEGYDFLLATSASQQVRWVKEHLDPGSYR